MTASPDRNEALLLIILTVANLVAFLTLGLHGRVELGYGLGLGSVEIFMGTGLFLAAAWVPWVVLDDPREARIFMLLIMLAFGFLILAT